MAKMNRREMMKQKMAERTKESSERKDDSGKFRNIFKTVEGLELWKPKSGSHIIDIIPYITGGNDPHLPKDEPAYVLDLWVHRMVGVNEDSVICPARNYDQPCPICEHQAELRKAEDYDEELVKSLSPKRRVVYNIICYDTKEEEEKGVQVFEVAHWFMEENLLPLTTSQRTGETIAFADPDNGKSISFEIEDSNFKDKQTGQSVKSLKYKGHRFEDRNYKISDEDLDDAFCLDDIIEVLPYDEIYKMYWGDVPEEDKQTEKKSGEEEKSSRRRTRESSSNEDPKKDNTNKCPGGGIFGKEIDELSECPKCEVWDDCLARKNQLEEDDSGRSNRAKKTVEKEEEQTGKEVEKEKEKDKEESTGSRRRRRR